MSKTVLCVLLKVLMSARADILSNYPDSDFIQDIPEFENNDCPFLQNLTYDTSHSDSMSVRNKVDKIPFANMSVIQEHNKITDIFNLMFLYIIMPICATLKFLENILSKPTFPRAFVEFYNRFLNEEDISVTFRWNQPNITDKLIQGYTVQCWFIENLKEMHICDDKSISATILECTVHNLKPNTTYYFQVQAHTKIGASSYTDLIDVSTTHENPIPQLLTVSDNGIDIWDLDSEINVNFVEDYYIVSAAYSIAEHKIYWSNGEKKLMMLKFKENNITEIAKLQNLARDLCIDWIARNLYWMESNYIFDFDDIMKLDLTMWENGIVKYDKIWEMRTYFNSGYLNILPSNRTLYWTVWTKNFKQQQIIQSDLDGKNARIFQHNNFSMCHFSLNTSILLDMKIDDVNTKKPLIYWLWKDFLIVTDINVSMCNLILQTKKNEVYRKRFDSLTIGKTYIYISLFDDADIYVLEKKYALLKSVNAFKYIKKVRAFSQIHELHAFGKSLQPYPPTRCLTPDKKVYNIRILTVTMSSIIVYLPEIVLKSGCKKYNLPTTLYTINITNYCLGDELNKFDNFTVQTTERYYEIQNLTSYTEYKLLLVINNFYSNQLSRDPLFVSEMIVMMRSKPNKLDAPENVTVGALTPTLAVVYWMPPKKLNMPVIYQIRIFDTNSMGEINKIVMEKTIGKPTYMGDGKFLEEIEDRFDPRLFNPGQKYMICVRIHPVNFSDHYNDSLSKPLYMYSTSNYIILKKANITSMIISWVPPVNLIINYELEYKNIEMKWQKWQIANNFKLNNGEEINYYIEELQPGTRYEFRLILRNPKYEEDLIWPSDRRLIFSTLPMSDISSLGNIKYAPLESTLGTLVLQYFLPILSFVAIVTLICVYYFYCYRQRKKSNEQVLPPIMTDIELETLHEIPNGNVQLNTLYSPMLEYNSDKYVLTEIKRKEIRLEKLLGSGAFGMVYQGKVKNLERPDIEIPVAIKMLKKNASSQEKNKFLEEARLMNHFRHKHVLRLLAVCLDKNSPLIVLELMEIGDLLHYLRDSRKFQPSDSHALRLQDLFAMCEDVARGCCYLENLRFVHRDLACRNCLVSAKDRENRVIKIGDFGLARDIYADDYYRMMGQGLLPICWMAPESLVIGIFTSQSDVWSFGVLMWEITSLGEHPYTGRTNLEVIDYVRAGGRLSIPLNCPPTLYELMLRCWNPANDRPNFKLCLETIIALRNNIEDTLLNPVDIV